MMFRYQVFKRLTANAIA